MTEKDFVQAKVSSKHGNRKTTTKAIKKKKIKIKIMMIMKMMQNMKMKMMMLNKKRKKQNHLYHHQEKHFLKWHL